jgi:hypothetical protein
MPMRSYSDHLARAAFEASHKFYGTTPSANAWNIPCVRDYWRAVVAAIAAAEQAKPIYPSPRARMLAEIEAATAQNSPTK